MSAQAAEALRKSGMPLPTGTVTFLFTDIEGSTERWDANRAAMQIAVKQHDDVLRAAIEAHNGYIFKTVGDAFCAAFDTVSDAIAAAMDGQAGLDAQDFGAVNGLRIRMALHTGNANERDGDYFGPAVNRVARLLSVGHGGQVLLSGVTAELGRTELPSRTSLRDLGIHRLKDLSNPEHVYQLVAPEFAHSFPPLRSLEAIPNNLPLQVTSFRGREQDLVEISGVLKEARLLTLCGTGGVGKTRLALQMSAEMLEQYPDGVWYVELASVSDLDLIPSVVSSVLNVSETPGRSLIQSIVAALNRKRLLIILDNCEHVLDAVVQLVSALLHGCPDVRIVVTSRQALAIAGETVLQVSSLGVPPVGAPPSAEQAMTYGAVALFVDRASAINRAFRLTDDTAPIVAEISRRLDGIALAIELAAARMKVLSVPQLAERLSERFRILTSGDRTVLKRQQTMRALIDWSYDQLTESEKLLFLRIAVFAGTFTLDGAAEVCSGAPLDSIDVLDLLSSLVDKSLLVAETTLEVARFRLLESTREYALEKLRAGEGYDELARSHARYYLKVAQDADASWGSTPREQWLAKFRPELDNFRVAIDWGLIKGADPNLGAAVAAYAAYLWYDAGLNSEGVRWIELAQAAAGAKLTADTRAKLWVALAPLVSGKRVYEAGSEARALYEELGNRRGIALADIQRAFGLFQIGRVEESLQFLPQTIVVLRELAEARILSIGLTIYGLVVWVQGDYESSRRSYSEALALAKSMNDERRVAIIQQNLAEVESSIGNNERSVELVTDVLEFYQRDYDRPGLSGASSNLAAYHILLGQFDEAEERARQSVRTGREAQLRYAVAISIQHLAHVAAVRRSPKRAARLLGYADSVYQQLGIQREPTEAKLYERLMATLSGQLDDGSMQTLLTEGAALNEDQAVDFALSADSDKPLHST